MENVNTEIAVQKTMADFINDMKSADQDFEWYPTTKEILAVIKADVDESFYNTPSVLDCGAGDGRALQFLTTGARYAIEKSRPLLQRMDRSIYIVGTEFREQTLIDKKVDVVFCNPPYSEFQTWMTKIIREANARSIYFVVPVRWQQFEPIRAAIQSREADTTTLGRFDFLNAERQARAEVEIVRIDLGYASRHRSDVRVSPFDLWFDDHFHLEIKKDETSKYDWKRETGGTLNAALRGELVAGSDLVTALERLYQRDLAHLMRNYKSVEDIDAELLRELDVNIDGLKGALRLKIEGLKDLYWRELFNNFDRVTSRLTTASRAQMLEKMTAHTHVDFTASNVYAVMIWVINNANVYLDDQLINLVERMTEKASVVLYVSNKTTFGDEKWRYCRMPENLDRYALDYRFVLDRIGGINNSSWQHERTQNGGLCARAAEFINDVLTVANNIGFDTMQTARAGAFQWESNAAVVFQFYDHVEGKHADLLKVRAFKNGNLHLSFNQSFMCRLNVEFGRLKGWLKSHVDAAHELRVNSEDLADCFNSNLQLHADSLLQLGHCKDAAAFADREELEIRTRECCPAEIWYDLLDTVDETPSEDLLSFIDQYEGEEDRV